MRITFKRFDRDGQVLLLPLVNGEELPARSCTIKQGYPEDSKAMTCSRAMIEVNLLEGIIIDE